MTDELRLYATGQPLTTPVARAIEDRLATDASARRELNAIVTGDQSDRLDTVLGDVLATTAAPRPGRLERLLLALRVPEPTARILAATPALRASWIVAVFLLLVFAGSAPTEQWAETDRIAWLLALAPLVPVAGVALAYGPGADRSHEVTVVAPMSGLRLLLLRASTVLVASIMLSTFAALMSAQLQLLSVAWLLPSLATTATTLALATSVGLRRAAYAVLTMWLLVVIASAQAASDAVAAFRAPGQVLAALVALAGAVALGVRRRRLEGMEGV